MAKQDLLNQIRDLKAESNAKKAEVRALTSGSDLEKAKEIMAKIQELETEIDKLQEEYDLLENIEGLEDHEISEPEERSAETDPEPNEEEVKQPEQQEDPKNPKPSEEKEEDTNPKGDLNEMREITNGQKDEQVRSFEAFIRTKGAEKRDGMTTVDGAPLIPQNISTTPVQTPETVSDLRRLVNKVGVTTGAGAYPVMKGSQAKMVSVAELAKNPELAKPNFTNVDYKIETYRGYIPVSQELVEDSEYDVLGLVDRHIQRLALNTANEAIANEMKTFPAKTISDLDGLKGILNVSIDPAYNSKVVMSQSFFNEVDIMKDNTGRYLLQSDVTVQSGYKLFGREVVVLADDIIGSKVGDKVAFVGDIEAAVTFFDRKQATVRWVENDIHGQVLAGFLRMDAKKADESAGFYVTFKAPVAG